MIGYKHVATGHDQDVDLSRYRTLVEKIAAGDVRAKEELYELLSRGIRFFLARQLPRTEDVEDELHNVFVIVVNAVAGGHLRAPERLIGFVRGVVRHRIASKIEEIMRMRRHAVLSDFAVGGPYPDIETTIANQERKDLAMDVLRRMSANDRDILMRFYLNEQTPEEICRDMHLSETQYRLLKSRAKARFVERCQRAEARRFGVGRTVAGLTRTRVA